MKFRCPSLFPGLFAFAVVMSRAPDSAGEIGFFGPGFGGTVGVGYGAGRLGDPGMDLRDRTMTALSLDALTGYRVTERWLLGPALGYRQQQQQTALVNAGNTNLAGHAYSLGFGAQYRPALRWAVKASLDLFGRYEFDKRTASGLDDHLAAPLTLRLTAHYFWARSWSGDLNLGLERWRTFHVGGVDRSEPARQWIAGAGISYHFGMAARAEAEAAPLPPVIDTAPPPAGKSAPAPDERRTVANFAPGSPAVDESLRRELAASTAEINTPPLRDVILEGHADSSGPERLNTRLSLRRAQAVRRVLISNGVAADRVRAVGRGSADPVADNKTAEGRALNRRVELRMK